MLDFFFFKGLFIEGFLLEVLDNELRVPVCNYKFVELNLPSLRLVFDVEDDIIYEPIGEAFEIPGGEGFIPDIFIIVLPFIYDNLINNIIVSTKLLNINCSLGLKFEFFNYHLQGLSSISKRQITLILTVKNNP